MRENEMKLSDLKIGEPAKRAFTLKGIYTVEDCANYTKSELLDLHGVGPKAIRIIEEYLTQLNMTYKKKLQ